MLLFHYPFMIPALVISLVLAGSHTYLGYHVVQRGVIFVDLALAQIAALGTGVAIVLGWGEDAPTQTYLMSLGFTLAGAVLFSFFRKTQSKVPIEALIGITYAAAIAMTLLILEKAATGTEHVKEMLVGTILTVSWKDVIQTSVLYAIVGIIHWVTRHRLFLITNSPTKASSAGVRIWWWDFLFYMTFGIVVTSAVRIAGVLLVFSLLTMPTVAAVFCVSKTVQRIVFGWVFGIAACVLGLEASLRLDLAAGPSIIGVLLVLLLACGGFAFIKGLRTHSEAKTGLGVY
ncbi:MAG: iron chelate uptake ABC transporter family permease subunit [Fibrobacterota bacterium]